MHMNLNIITSVLMALLVVRLPTPTYIDPYAGVVYDEFIDESYHDSSSNWFDY